MEVDLIVYVSVPEIFFVRVGIPNTDTEELLEHQPRCTMGQSQNVKNWQLSLSNSTHNTHVLRHMTDTGGELWAYNYE